MAEDKRANPYPYPVASEVEAAPGTREQKAARNIMVRHIEGIPKRGFLLGQSDNSPIMRGVHDLTTVVYEMTDAIRRGAEHDVLAQHADVVEAMMEHHGCPDAEPLPTGEG